MSQTGRICVFAGSAPGNDERFAEAAARMAQSIAAAGLGVVYGGGKAGLMGVVADTALAEGAEVIGVIPSALEDREIGHHGITELRVVGSMHERKALMAELGDAFVAVPGGFGTLDELAEVITWNQLGIHDKPVGLLDVGGYWQPLLRWVDDAVAAGFVAPASRDHVLSEDDPSELIRALGL